VWRRLMDAGYTNALPWTESTNANDFAAANIGQVKYLFGFDLRPDADGDGLADWRETGTGVFVDPSHTGSSATNADSDGDGVLDGAEVTARTDPNNSDTNRPTVIIGFPTNNCLVRWMP